MPGPEVKPQRQPPSQLVTPLPAFRFLSPSLVQVPAPLTWVTDYKPLTLLFCLQLPFPPPHV